MVNRNIQAPAVFKLFDLEGKYIGERLVHVEGEVADLYRIGDRYYVRRHGWQFRETTCEEIPEGVQDADGDGGTE